MVNRGAWVIAALALAFVGFLMFVMAKSLDTKAPVRIERPTAPPAVPTPTPLTPEEAAARDEEAMRGVVVRLAPGLAARAAEQAFASEDRAQARCTFTSATLVSRASDSAYWRLDYGCADVRRPEALPNLTSVSVRLLWDGKRWAAEP